MTSASSITIKPARTRERAPRLSAWLVIGAPLVVRHLFDFVLCCVCFFFSGISAVAGACAPQANANNPSMATSRVRRWGSRSKCTQRYSASARCTTTLVAPHWRSTMARRTGR